RAAVPATAKGAVVTTCDTARRRAIRSATAARNARSRAGGAWTENKACSFSSGVIGPSERREQSRPSTRNMGLHRAQWQAQRHRRLAVRPAVGQAQGDTG